MLLQRKLTTQYGIAIGLTALTTLILWSLREVLTLANFSLLYLLVTLLIATGEGIGPALLAAVLSFLCLNFFLVRPFYTFIVADSRELLDLVIFLIVGVVTGQLAARARQQAENARQRAHEQDILYHLTSALNQLTTAEDIHKALVRVLREDLSVNVAYILPDAAPLPPNLQRQTSSYILSRSGDHVYGILYVGFDAPPTSILLRLVNACAAQAAIALERIELAERNRQSDAFEEADRLKTTLLRAVSHDLRTPITIIKTSANNLLNLYTTLSDEDRVDNLKMIENEADQLNKMVGNLLDLSRLQAGAYQLNISLNSLEEIAGDVAARAFQLTRQERVKIYFPDDLPLVPFDYGLLLQAVSNLVENALRYEPPDSQVEIRGQVHEEEIVVAIANHGPTILPEERVHVMEPFFRGKEGNIGLGLAIAKAIVEAHHGQLRLEDTPGGGATFILTLPCAIDNEEKVSGNEGIGR